MQTADYTCLHLNFHKLGIIAVLLKVKSSLNHFKSLYLLQILTINLPLLYIEREIIFFLIWIWIFPQEKDYLHLNIKQQYIGNFCVHVLEA